MTQAQKRNSGFTTSPALDFSVLVAEGTLAKRITSAVSYEFCHVLMQQSRSCVRVRLKHALPCLLLFSIVLLCYVDAWEDGDAPHLLRILCCCCCYCCCCCCCSFCSCFCCLVISRREVPEVTGAKHSNAMVLILPRQRVCWPSC